MGIGRSMTRVDALDEVTGSARYTAGLEPQGLLVAEVVCSTIVNDVVKSFDLGETQRMPGVVKVVTCFDIPDIQFPTPGHPWSVETAHRDAVDGKLLNTRVWAYGDDIAAVIAEDDITAARAAGLVKMEYEKHAPLLTVEDAMTEDASRLHDEEPGNVTAHSSFAVGEGTYGETVREEGLVEIERNYRTQSVQYCHVETPIPSAYMEKGGVIVATSIQISHIVRRVISQALGLPISHIHVVKPCIGGGFGSKQDILHGPLNAFLIAQVGGRGVRTKISREEALGYTRACHAIGFRVKAIIRKDDTLVAGKLKAYSNQGGYTFHARAVVVNSSNKFKQIYEDEKVLESDARAVYTNLAIGSTMRGYGVPQAAFAAGCIADDLALALHMGPLEFRKKNCMRLGYIDPHTRVKCNTCDLTGYMEKSREFIRWNEKYREYEN